MLRPRSLSAPLVAATPKTLLPAPEAAPTLPAKAASDRSHVAVEPAVVARTAPIPKSPPLQGARPPKAPPLQLLEQGHVLATEAQRSRAFGSDGSHLAVEKAPPTLPKAPPRLPKAPPTLPKAPPTLPKHPTVEP